MKVSIDSVRPTVATASGPRRDTKNTSTTANTDSSASSRTIGMASTRMARPIGPSVYAPRCVPAIDSRTVDHSDGATVDVCATLMRDNMLEREALAERAVQTLG